MYMGVACIRLSACVSECECYKSNWICARSMNRTLKVFHIIIALEEMAEMLLNASYFIVIVVVIGALL